jgi:hypothetical protein
VRTAGGHEAQKAENEQESQEENEYENVAERVEEGCSLVATHYSLP